MVVYRDENNHGYIMSLGEYYGIWAERDLDIGIKSSVSTDGLELFQIVKNIPGWRERLPMFAWCESLNEEYGENRWYIPLDKETDLFNSHSRVWMINAGAPSITT